MQASLQARECWSVMQGRAVLISHARSAPGDKTGGSVPKDGFLDPKFLKTQVARVQYVDSQQERGKGGRQRGEEWGVAKSGNLY